MTVPRPPPAMDDEREDDKLYWLDQAVAAMREGLDHANP